MKYDQKHTDDDGDLVLTSLHGLNQSSEGDGGLVLSAHDESLEDDTVEVRSGSAVEEPVELDEESQVDIVALDVFASGALSVLVT